MFSAFALNNGAASTAVLYEQVFGSGRCGWPFKPLTSRSSKMTHFGGVKSASLPHSEQLLAGLDMWLRT